jgi:hypothetical protein
VLVLIMGSAEFSTWRQGSALPAPPPSADI